MTVRILQGDCRDVLKTLPDQSVHCVVTSPPYWGLRDYGVPGQIGLEPAPSNYVNDLHTVFNELSRVLREDGTVWLNLGDSYCGGNTGNQSNVGQRYGDGKKGGGVPTVKHDTPQSAKQEAQRLAVANPGEQFHVLQIIGTACYARVDWHEYGEYIPF